MTTVRRVWCAWLLSCACALDPALAAAEPGAGRGFIWRVERDGRAGWLVGSLHVLTRQDYPLPPAMDAAFRDATALLEEIDLDDAGSAGVAAAMTAAGFYAAGDGSLAQAVSVETYRLARERATKLGLEADQIDRMKPWLLSVLLSATGLQQAGFEPSLGVDRHFHDRAARLGTRRGALETAAGQLQLFAALPAATQEAMLRDTLRGAPDEAATMAALAAAWRQGDAAALERLVIAPMRDDPALYQSLVAARNRQWLPVIESCVAGDRCFVVVGAGHLVGADGLLAALARNGFLVRQQ